MKLLAIFRRGMINFFPKFFTQVMLVLGTCTIAYGYVIPEPPVLTLSEAEFLATRLEPELQRTQANTDALNQQAIADAQLSDPQLMASAINVPTNTFSFNQDDMTMIEVGIQQTFPPGHSRAIKSQQTSAMAQAERSQLQNQKLILSREVRDTWLDLYYWTQAARVVETNRATFAALLKAVKSQYSSGKNNLSDVSQAELELSRLEDQKIQVAQQIDLLRAQLGRWIGPDEAAPTIASSLPAWREPPPLAVLQSQLQHHPLLQVDTANIQVAHEDVAFAKEQYKPGITADLAYGIRQGTMEDGARRSDMVTAGVTVDLPVFTAQRQDRRVKAGEYRLEASELERVAHYRDLRKDLQSKYALYQELSKRVTLYQKQLTPEAIQNAHAVLLAYQSAAADITTVLRAKTNALSIQLEQLQVQVERAKARVALLYFEGLLS